MTNYERGFISRCAERGVDGAMLLKLAQQTMYGVGPRVVPGTRQPAPDAVRAENGMLAVKPEDAASAKAVENRGKAPKTAKEKIMAALAARRRR